MTARGLRDWPNTSPAALLARPPGSLVGRGASRAIHGAGARSDGRGPSEPFNQARLRVATGDRVLYRAGKDRSGRSAIRPFPAWASPALRTGAKRNFEVYDPLDFLAQITQHIPDPNRHLVLYYGHYSNRSRGKRRLAAEAAEMLAAAAMAGRPPSPPPAPDPPDPPDLARLRMQARSRWAALIKRVYEVDPLTCEKCGGEMRIIAFLTREEDVRRVLKTA